MLKPLLLIVDRLANFVLDLSQITAEIAGKKVDLFVSTRPSQGSEAARSKAVMSALAVEIAKRAILAT